MHILAVIVAQEHIDIIQTEVLLIGQRLDLRGDDLDLIVGQVKLQLLGPLLDGVPAGQPMGDVHVAGQPEVGRIQDLVGARGC